MSQRVRIAAAVVFVAGLILLLPEAWFSPRVQVAVSTAAASLALAVAALAGARYRTARDPHASFLTAGFAVIAAQSLVFGVWWPIHYGQDVAYALTIGTTTVQYEPLRSFSGLAPVYAFLAGKPNVRREPGNSIPLTPLKGRPGTEIVVLNYK